MAKTVDKFPDGIDRHGSIWDVYLDGKIWELVEGADCKDIKYAQQAISQRARGLKLKCKTRTVGKHLYVQVTGAR